MEIVASYLNVMGKAFFPLYRIKTSSFLGSDLCSPFDGGFDKNINSRAVKKLRLLVREVAK